jgi:hypothetical protein
MAGDPLLDATLESPEIGTLTSEMLAVTAPFLPQFEPGHSVACHFPGVPTLSERVSYKSDRSSI